MSQRRMGRRWQRHGPGGSAAGGKAIRRSLAAGRSARSFKALIDAFPGFPTASQTAAGAEGLPNLASQLGLCLHAGGGGRFAEKNIQTYQYNTTQYFESALRLDDVLTKK